MRIKISLLLFVCFLSSNFLFAQNPVTDKDENDSTSEATKSFFSATTSFNTNSGFAGRFEKTYNPVIGASASYNFKSGIYFSAETDLTPTQNVLFGGFSLKGGYEFDIIEDLLSADVNYTHFFAENTTKILSEMVGSASGTLSCDLDWFSLAFTPAYNYGNKTNDILLTFEINKTINLFTINKEPISITPGIRTFAGTQKLLELNANKKNAKKNIVVTALNAEYAKFNYLNTDLEIPISYTHKAITVELTPTLSLPTNLVQSARFISNPFFVDLSVSIKI